MHIEEKPLFCRGKKIASRLECDRIEGGLGGRILPRAKEKMGETRQLTSATNQPGR